MFINKKLALFLLEDSGVPVDPELRKLSTEMIEGLYREDLLRYAKLETWFEPFFMSFFTMCEKEAAKLTAHEFRVWTTVNTFKYIDRLETPGLYYLKQFLLTSNFQSARRNYNQMNTMFDHLTEDEFYAIEYSEANSHSTDKVEQHPFHERFVESTARYSAQTVNHFSLFGISSVTLSAGDVRDTPEGLTAWLKIMEPLFLLRDSIASVTGDNEIKRRRNYRKQTLHQLKYGDAA